jgi:hypothetical protein
MIVNGKELGVLRVLGLMTERDLKEVEIEEFK